MYQFKPTYLPKDKSIDQVRKEVVSAIKAAAPSYGVFSEQGSPGSARVQGEALKAVAPLNNIPNIKDRAVPQFLLRGTSDTLIRNAEVQSLRRRAESGRPARRSTFRCRARRTRFWTGSPTHGSRPRSTALACPMQPR